MDFRDRLAVDMLLASGIVFIQLDDGRLELYDSIRSIVPVPRELARGSMGDPAKPSRPVK